VSASDELVYTGTVPVMVVGTGGIKAKRHAERDMPRSHKEDETEVSGDAGRAAAAAAADKTRQASRPGATAAAACSN